VDQARRDKRADSEHRKADSDYANNSFDTQSPLGLGKKGGWGSATKQEKRKSRPSIWDDHFKMGREKDADP